MLSEMFRKNVDPVFRLRTAVCTPRSALETLADPRRGPCTFRLRWAALRPQTGDQRDKVDKFGARVRLQITALGGSDRALTMEFRFVLFDSSDG